MESLAKRNARRCQRCRRVLDPGTEVWATEQRAKVLRTDGTIERIEYYTWRCDDCTIEVGI